MGQNSVPPRWEEYKKMGKVIPGSRIITFKVPLKEEICRNLREASEAFTIFDLMENQDNVKISMIVDLTLTDRFYNVNDLRRWSVKHHKMRTQGGGSMPSEREVRNFCHLVSEHLRGSSDPDSVVGVHCTHGLNRTGYFVCRYLIDCLNMSGSEAVQLFEASRGHTFDRLNYRGNLLARQVGHFAISLLLFVEPHKFPLYFCSLDSRKRSPITTRAPNKLTPTESIKTRRVSIRGRMITTVEAPCLVPRNNSTTNTDKLKPFKSTETESIIQQWRMISGEDTTSISNPRRSRVSPRNRRNATEKRVPSNAGETGNREDHELSLTRND